MNILADENCGLSLISALTAAGHDVTSIFRISPGMGDGGVFELAVRENRVLLTHDLGFGRVAERAEERPPAVILMRMKGISGQARARIVVQAISDLGSSLFGHFVVVEPTGVRSRPYKSWKMA